MEMTVGNAGWRDESFSENQRGKMHVFFYDKQVPHPAKSRAENRPVFVTQVRIKKLVPGDQYNQPDRPMRYTDIEEFPEQWARYQQKKEAKIPGTPLEAWGILTDTQVAEYKAMNIFTVDQFATLTDSAGMKIMGFNQLRKRAQLFVDAQKNGEAAEHLKEELTKRDDVIAQLTARLDALENGNKPEPAMDTSQLQGPQLVGKENEAQFDAPRRGRPPKIPAFTES